MAKPKTSTTDQTTGLKVNAEMLRASIAQREKRKGRTDQEQEGLETVLNNEKARLAEIEAELEFLNKQPSE